MAYDKEQRKVAKKLYVIGKKMGMSPMEIKSAFETGIVESKLRNLNYGHADSQGWRQERASLYKDPMNLDASIKRYYSEVKTARKRKKYIRAGDIAADVQRPAAAYRGRYHGVSAEADKILKELGLGIRGRPITAASASRKGPLGGVDKKAMLLEALKTSRPGGRSKRLLQLAASGQYDLPDAPTRPSRSTAPTQPAAPRGSGSLVREAQGLDRDSSRFGTPITAKQEPGHQSGGDHDPAVRGATARDFGGTEAQRKAFFLALTKRLGVKNAVYKGADINVVVNGLRYQIISRDHGTGPHLHVGIREV